MQITKMKGSQGHRITCDTDDCKNGAKLFSCYTEEAVIAEAKRLGWLSDDGVGTCRFCRLQGNQG